MDPSKKKSNASGKKARSGADAAGVDIALDASELEGLDQEALKEKYEAAAEAQAAGRTGGQEDLSDMVAEHAAAQVRKRKPPAASSAAPKKKAKDFKF
ncbi:Splicing factor 3B subunit 2 [Coemansia guatemalensis]|uniref:Splicing factor 3B subunit 2 n=1 Tax=Coemansia guatemalensis TaxID=2761395 RepID=A0A9W8HQU4_9FUNG|nr:Splicing factor 3B subunit 2 [Coemansia guatemalensis]